MGGGRIPRRGGARVFAQHAGGFRRGFVFANPPPPDIDPRAVARTLNRYKVADNNSPLPRTRLLYSFNFFGSAFDTKGRIYRNFFGGEYAFLNQRVSIDARFNFNYYEGFDNSNNETQVGNFFTTLKGLIWRSETLAVSTGLAIGWPTGDFPTALPSDNTYVMPFLGALYYRPESRLYFQGFQQIDFPTQDKDQCLLHTDLGIGYFLLQDHPGLINAIAGTTEFHLYTPLGGAAGGLYRGMAYDDVLNMTVGATAMTRYNVTVASAVSFPISHERDYAVEFQCHVNWYFRGLGRAYPPAPIDDEF